MHKSRCLEGIILRYGHSLFTIIQATIVPQLFVQISDYWSAKDSQQPSKLLFKNINRAKGLRFSHCKPNVRCVWLCLHMKGTHMRNERGPRIACMLTEKQARPRIACMLTEKQARSPNSAYADGEAGENSEKGVVELIIYTMREKHMSCYHKRNDSGNFAAFRNEMKYAI